MAKLGNHLASPILNRYPAFTAQALLEIVMDVELLGYHGTRLVLIQ